ncbi:MAG: hypothetical protein LQ340_001122 [Diploschistes diacapsis]|nr:MAG: hypothetical protein LQ340_001122 [Diploschistes diacapsis]
MHVCCCAAVVALTGVFLSLSSVVAQPIKARDDTVAASAPQASVVWTFPQDTWVENLAVRSNGQILATLFTSPQLYQVDPTGNSPASLVHTFPQQTSCLGIAELGTDIFYVVAGNVSLTTFASVPGSFNVYKVDMTGYSPGGNPSVSKVANFPQGKELNGMTVLNAAQDLLAIADSAAGSVFSLNVNTAAVSPVVDDSTMSPNSNIAPIGVNGVKVHGNKIYFTNTNRNTYTSIPMNSTGHAMRSASTLSTTTSPDDFTFDSNGQAYFAGNDAVMNGPVTGGNLSVFSNSPLVKGSTACKFGRTASDSGTLYVSTNGGLDQYLTGSFTNPGKIVAIPN